MNNRAKAATLKEFVQERRSDAVYHAVAALSFTTIPAAIIAYFHFVIENPNNISYPFAFEIAPLAITVLCVCSWYQYAKFRVYIEELSAGIELMQCFLVISVMGAIYVSYQKPSLWMVLCGYILFVWALSAFLFAKVLRKTKYAIFVSAGKFEYHPLLGRMNTCGWIAFNYSVAAFIIGLILSWLLQSDAAFWKKAVAQIFSGVATIAITISAVLIFPTNKEELEVSIENFLLKRGVLKK
ncbi:MAG: hypothetical protein Q8N91_07200 [Candidatus Omnitrophota bacterium]|nr:hypothetical protein [Candidatus Omnitrophota bacterium]